MNFVALCTERPAPSAIGFCRSGVAKVLSTPTIAPASFPAAHSAGRSATSSIGLVGDSIHRRSARPAASIDAAVSATSIGSTRQRPFRPPSASRLATPW